jgi:hypothetical protein
MLYDTKDHPKFLDELIEETLLEAPNARMHIFTLVENLNAKLRPDAQMSSLEVKQVIDSSHLFVFDRREPTHVMLINLPKKETTPHPDSKYQQRRDRLEQEIRLIREVIRILNDPTLFQRYQASRADTLYLARFEPLDSGFDFDAKQFYKTLSKYGFKRYGKHRITLPREYETQTTRANNDALRQGQLITEQHRQDFQNRFNDPLRINWGNVSDGPTDDTLDANDDTNNT